jgi:uncharacterized BrkB/YihY/UPF0761 family membrane protein
VLRWPLGVLLLIVVATMVFKWSPRRCQPGLSWMVLGGFVSVGLWVAFSVAMSGFLRWSNSFGDTYGPLAGIVALLLWSFFSGIALFLGLAVTAQLEAERGDRHNPESTAKVVASEPDQQGRVLVRA